ncbi:MAG TPA: cupin domain-containing protein [Candidatus Saccharimonadales bacterium]|nr:cupin domain-containing protein [Candidatus Saccharimonadales bacterium]
MSLADQYFRPPGEGNAPTAKGHFLDLAQDVEPVVFQPGLEFRPAVGEATMVNSVHFAPHTVAPRHAHDEEQITVVVEGELEFDLDGEVRLLSPGMVAVIPANVPHGARTGEQPCHEYDVFNPPRQALLALRGESLPGETS